MNYFVLILIVPILIVIMKMEHAEKKYVRIIAKLNAFNMKDVI